MECIWQSPGLQDGGQRSHQHYRLWRCRRLLLHAGPRTTRPAMVFSGTKISEHRFSSVRFRGTINPIFMSKSVLLLALGLTVAVLVCSIPVGAVVTPSPGRGTRQASCLGSTQTRRPTRRSPRSSPNTGRSGGMRVFTITPTSTCTSCRRTPAKNSSSI